MVNRQQFNNSTYQDIAMVRGDSLNFNFQLQGTEGSFPTAVTLTCAEHYDQDPIFTADLESGISLIDYDQEGDIATYGVSLRPDQTAYQAVGRYYYDLQMVMDDNVITLMRGNLDLLFDQH